MSKKAAVLLAIALATTSLSAAELRVSRRSNYTGKFMVIRKLVSLSESKSENVAISALNRLREVLFRSENLLTPAEEPGKIISLSDLVDKMNYDVDKIHQAVFNLENAIQVANLDDAKDRKILSAVKVMIVEEIKQILGSNVFLSYHEQLTKTFQQAEKNLEADSGVSANARIKNRNAMANIEKLLDLAWYIYAEQSQWLMVTAFRLECLNLDQASMKMPLAIDPELNLSSPPRMFVPGSIEDYQLICAED